MKCPECGTQLPTGKKECHFCHYVIIQNTDEANQHNSTQNLEDPDWYISSYQSAQLSMMAIMLSAIALIITGSAAWVDSSTTKISITTGNITETPPIFVTMGPIQLPLIIIVISLIGLSIFVMCGAFLYLTNKAKKAHDEKKKA